MSDNINEKGWDMAEDRERQELHEMVAEYRDCRARRGDLEKQVEAIKLKEEALKACIMNVMSSMGVRSLTFEDVGRVGLRGVRHYEVMNSDMFMKFVFQKMLSNMEKGAPLIDGVALQKRVSATVIDEWLENTADDRDEEIKLRLIGLRRVETPSLSITKS